MRGLTFFLLRNVEHTLCDLCLCYLPRRGATKACVLWRDEVLLTSLAGSLPRRFALLFTDTIVVNGLHEMNVLCERSFKMLILTLLLSLLFPVFV